MITKQYENNSKFQFIFPENNHHRNEETWSNQDVMLLPDQTYEEAVSHFEKFTLKDINDQKLAKENHNPLRNTSSSSSKDDYKVQDARSSSSHDSSADNYNRNTFDFFNAPAKCFETSNCMRLPISNDIEDTTSSGDDPLFKGTNILRECELFLWQHNIRPDFFCRYHKAIR